MTLFTLIALLVSLAFYIVSKIIQQTNQKQRFWSYFNISVGEYLLIAVMFCLYQFCISLPIYIRYPQEGGKMMAGSIIVIILYLAVLVFSTCLFIIQGEEYFGEFKKFFNADKFSQAYYLIPIYERMAIGIILGACRDPYASGIVIIFILAGSLIVLAVKKPFIDSK